MSILDHLRSRDVRFETFLHRPAASATRLAQSVHVPGRRVAKGVLLRRDDQFVLTVLPATARVDLARLSDVFPGSVVRLASEEDVARVFSDCELGALPPFGRAYGLPTLVDASLMTASEIVCVGNQRHEGLRMRVDDYVAAEAPQVASFATVTSSQRRAG